MAELDFVINWDEASAEGQIWMRVSHASRFSRHFGDSCRQFGDILVVMIFKKSVLSVGNAPVKGLHNP